jgi:hypothetical protein
LLPLTPLTTSGMAVLAMHHPGKGEPPLGQAARGSGALLAHVDVSMEMRHPGGDPLTRRRRLLSLSRHAATPRQLLLELNPGGTDYTVIPEEQQDGFLAGWYTLKLIFEDAPQKLTREDILGEWPADFDKPSPSNLRKWLIRAVDRALVACEGSGRRADPFRYWLPATEVVWKADPLYDLLKEVRRNEKFRSLTEKKRLAREDRRLGAHLGDEE